MFKISRERTVIGRGPKSDIRIGDEGVSREHACVVIDGDKVVLEDLQSTNGTFCNGVRVARRELSDGDKIMVGSTTILKFTYHDYLDEVFQRQMYESALRDGLTKVFNKKYFNDLLDKEFSYSIRHSTSLTLLFIDIDYFKRINDQYGHQAGDSVLADLAGVVSRVVRTEDVLARFGGEEFVVLCRDTGAEGGGVLAERLRTAVEEHRFGFGGKEIPVTISVGVASLPDPTIKTAAAILAAADKALYEAKRGGRNRVGVAARESAPPST
jgi:diguanylate cyclase (GGDEF)-like protein